jgi:hypothetical protein
MPAQALRIISALCQQTGSATPMGSISWSVLGAIASFLLGGVGWFATNFFAKPYLDFRNLRSQVDEQLISTWNVAPIAADIPGYQTAQDSLRDLGAKVLTTNNTASPPLRWYLSKAGYDLAKASAGLNALSKSLADSYPHHRLIYTDRIQEGLKLQRDSTPELLREMKEQIHQGRHNDR